MDSVKQAFESVRRQAVLDGAQVELLLTGGERIALKFQKQKLQSFDSSQSQMAGIRVLFQNQQGYAYTERIEAESLLRTYQDALENAKAVKKPTTVELAMVKPSAFVPLAGLVVSEEIPLEKKMEVASQIESSCLRKDPRIDSVPYGAFSESKGFKRILNSEGLDQSYSSGAYVIHSSPLAKSGDSSKMMGNSLVTRSFSDLNVDKMTSSAVADVVSLLNAEKLKTGSYAVVIRGDQAEMILDMISGYFSAKLVYEKKSLLKDKMETVIASDKWTLLDDPLNISGMAARPFDDEGSVSKTTTLIEKGVLKNFLTNYEYSQKMNLPLTAHASRAPSSEMGISTSNLFVKRGEQSREQLLSRYPQTVLITHFTAGLHAGYNDTTGDISMPCEGILYQDGKVVKAVDQFILSINVLDLMKQTEAMGDSYMESSSGYFCPDILISPVMLAGG